MTLKTRVIPCLLYRDNQLVKGQKFNSWRGIGSVIPAVKLLNVRGVDELIILDIGASPSGVGPDFELVKEICSHCYMPVTVGGGISSLEDIRKLLECGADKVSIGTCATPEFVKKASEKFGKQCIVVCIDVVRSFEGMPCARAAEQWGAGEILLQSIEREGTMDGYDLDLIREVSSAVSIPVIASCGAGRPEHMREAIEAGAHAASAGAMFFFTDYTPIDCSRHLSENGIECRVS